MGECGEMGRWGDGEMGRWGVLDICQNPIIKSIITHFFSKNSPENLFSGDTLRGSIDITLSFIQTIPTDMILLWWCIVMVDIVWGGWKV